MLKKSKIVLELALIICSAGAVLLGADVKLRIYLQDGTLQSGNLVTETPESFVVLTRDGRAEVPKDKIMFINGKTLKQWQERPDKLFSTEILPSDIPNPSYVNDKAALPTPPSASAKSAQLTKNAVTDNKSRPVPAVDKAATEPVPIASAHVSAQQAAVPAAATVVSVAPVIAAHPKTVESVAAVSTKAAAPVAAEPATSGGADSAIPLKTVAARKSKRHGHGKHMVSETASSAATAVKTGQPAPSVVKVSADNSTEAVAPVGAALALPARFSRKEYADVYYQQALHDIDQHRMGSALHELHIAAVLNRQDPEPTFLLGKIYMQQGLLNHARKFLSHPILKKREDAKALLDQIALLQEQKKTSHRILYAATGAGAFAWIPLIFLLRRARRAPRRVITAETAMPSPFPDKTEKAVEKRDEILPILEDILAAKSVSTPNPIPAPSTEPAFMKLTPEFPKAPIAAPPIIPLPVFSKPLQPSLPAPELPPMLPIVVPVMEVSAPNGFIPPSAVSIPDTDAILRLAAMVEQAVRKGNAFAVEEQFSQAGREYRTALALNPSCLEANLGMAYLCFSQGQLDLALEHYGRCMKIDPASADAHYGMGRVLLETDRVNEAVLEFQQTLTLDPSFDDARETLTSLDALA